VPGDSIGSDFTSEAFLFFSVHTYVLAEGFDTACQALVTCCYYIMTITGGVCERQIDYRSSCPKT
jgi:hypothetical protein